MKTKILQEFLNSDIKIKSKEKLEQYIDYCIKNNQKERIKCKTSYHHILPKSLFPLYSKLKENPWNGTHLLYSEHYYVHWLITESIDDYGQLHAFVAMHNKDIKNGRIEEKDLIPKDEFQEKMEERGNKYREWYNKIIIVDGFETTNGTLLAKRISETKREKPSFMSEEMKTHLSIINTGVKNAFYGKKHSEVTKNKWNRKGTQVGDKNHNSKIIHIYDNENILRYICEGNFLEVCKSNGLPAKLGTSYRDNGKPIYLDVPNSTISMLINKGFYQYKGWYALKI